MDTLTRQIIVPMWNCSHRDIDASLGNYNIKNELFADKLTISRDADYRSIPPIPVKNNVWFAYHYNQGKSPEVDNENGAVGYVATIGNVSYYINSTSCGLTYKSTDPNAFDLYVNNSKAWGSHDKDGVSFSISFQTSFNIENTNDLHASLAYKNDNPYTNNDTNNYRKTPYTKTDGTTGYFIGDWFNYRVKTKEQVDRKLLGIRIRTAKVWQNNPQEMVVLGRNVRYGNWTFIQTFTLRNLKLTSYKTFEYYITNTSLTNYNEYRLVFTKNYSGERLEISELMLLIDRTILNPDFLCKINDQSIVSLDPMLMKIGNTNMLGSAGLKVYGNIFANSPTVRSTFNPLGISSIQDITGSANPNTTNLGLSSIQSETGVSLMNLSQTSMFLPSIASSKYKIPTTIELGTIVEGKLYQVNKEITPFVLPVKCCQYITQSGTYILPLRYKKITVEIWGAGGGGGSGVLQMTPSTTGQALSGGAGGASGAYGRFTLYYHQVLTSNITITIGAGGAGGTAQSFLGTSITTTTLQGVDGGMGEDTSVSFTSGAYTAYWNVKGGSGGGGGLNGLNTTANSGGLSTACSGVFDTVLSGQNSISNTTNTPSQPANTTLVYQVGAGGNGGGTGSSPALYFSRAGTNSGAIVKPTVNHTLKTGYTTYSAGGTGSSAPNGANALTIQDTLHACSGAGGGASLCRNYQKTLLTAGNGGNGMYGSGGGGGGAEMVINANTISNDTYASGAGGAGGNGLVRISIQ